MTKKTRTIPSRRAAFVSGAAGGVISAAAFLAGLYAAENAGLLTKVEDAVTNWFARARMDPADRAEYDRLRAQVGKQPKLSRGKYDPELLGEVPTGTALTDLTVTQLIAEIVYAKGLVAAAGDPFDVERWQVTGDHLAALQSRFTNLRWDNGVSALDKMRLAAATDGLYETLPSDRTPPHRTPLQLVETDNADEDSVEFWPVDQSPGLEGSALRDIGFDRIVHLSPTVAADAVTALFGPEPGDSKAPSADAPGDGDGGYWHAMHGLPEQPGPILPGAGDAKNPSADESDSPAGTDDGPA